MSVDHSVSLRVEHWAVMTAELKEFLMGAPWAEMMAGLKVALKADPTVALLAASMADRRV